MDKNDYDTKGIVHARRLVTQKSKLPRDNGISRKKKKIRPKNLWIAMDVTVSNRTTNNWKPT